MENASKENKNWVSVEPVVWKPKKEGDFVQGVLIAKEEKIGKFGSDAYFVEGEEQTFVVFGSAVLDRLMKLVNIDQLVKIVFKGTEESEKGNDMKLFEVFKRKAIEPSSHSQGGEEQ